MDRKIWLSPPHQSGIELEFVARALGENWLAPAGPYLETFERELSLRLNNKRIVALNTGTSALHLALRLLGVQKGDTVIAPTLTYVASANPIVYLGANPIFVDTEDLDYHLSPYWLEVALRTCAQQGKLPKAVIVAHLFGGAANLAEIVPICRKYEVPLVEDACESLGAKFAGQNVGTYGEFAALSFNGNKLLTTGGGGALICQNEENAQEAERLATQAKLPTPHYEHDVLGYNYRMSSVAAAIGLGQLEKFEERIALRRRNYDYYAQRLAKIKQITFLRETQNIFSTHWLSVMQIEPSEKVTRETLRLALETRNIESRPVWKPLHLQPIYEHCPFFGAGNANELFEKGLCLPSGSDLTLAELDKICGIIETCFL